MFVLFNIFANKIKYNSSLKISLVVSFILQKNKHLSAYVFQMALMAGNSALIAKNKKIVTPKNL